MKTLVMGAGAVGCYYGAMLARAGHPVTLVGRQRHVEVINRDGLNLETAAFSERLPVRATVSPAAAADAELVLVCVKSGDTESAGRELAPHLAEDAIVLSLQNGVDNADRLAQVLDRPVIPAVVYVAVEMAGPGHVRHHGRGDLLIGASARSPEIAALLTAASIPTAVSDDVLAALWDKLIINCAFNALSAIPQLPYGELVKRDQVLQVMHDVAAECLAVAAAAGIRVNSDPRIAIGKIAESMATQYSSTAQDLAAGRPSEIEHLNGYIVKTGARLQVPTPVNRALYALVRLMERGGSPLNSDRRP
ncbi:ketopantoate reductase family protein [uncultured Nevskia sp.]|uniref:ketopantoate reductase family protein n=1 Tax=uncultured Nevskia sp. TaxID=228950 RepID=UPI0025E72BB0|nr:ketopantoate reductase family protein [uncultured Nevskia sp.]